MGASSPALLPPHPETGAAELGEHAALLYKGTGRQTSGEILVVPVRAGRPRGHGGYSLSLRPCGENERITLL